MKNRFNAFSAFAACLLILSAAPAIAQKAPERVLAAADVNAYIANFNAIQADLDALGDTYDDYFPDAFDVEDGNSDLTASFLNLRNLTPPAEVAAIMKKNGLGDRGFVKFVVISYCVGITAMETAYDLYASQYAGNAQMTAYLADAKKNVDAMKGTVHSADLALVASRQKELAPLLEMGDSGY